MEGPGKRLKKPGQSTSKALKRTHNGCSRLFVAVRGSASCACLYVLARGSSRLFVVTRAVMWLLVAVCGCMWVSVAVRTCGRWFLLSGPVLDPVFGPHLGTGKRTPKRRAADSNPQSVAACSRPDLGPENGPRFGTSKTSRGGAWKQNTLPLLPTMAFVAALRSRRSAHKRSRAGGL